MPLSKDEAVIAVEASVESLRTKYKIVQRLGEKAEGLVESVVQQYASDLDRFVRQVDNILDETRDGKRQLDDMLLGRLVLRLPILMYRLGSMVDRAAIESDMAKAVKSNVHARHYLNSQARTIPARNAEAELKTADEASLVDLSKHVYQRLKSKLEHADALYDGIKKVMSARDAERGLFRKDRG